MPICLSAVLTSQRTPESTLIQHLVLDFPTDDRVVDRWRLTEVLLLAAAAMPQN